jgi:hypothetical protein
MTLNLETERLLREFFAAHTCWKCGGVAARLHQGRFYCAHHFLPATDCVPARPKVFHHPVGMRG